VFKGGTCLAKIYADFYRLSEDLESAFLTSSIGISRHAPDGRSSSLKGPY
jgi:predicted nucleotidyltransferase component of viral defense system